MPFQQTPTLTETKINRKGLFDSAVQSAVLPTYAANTPVKTTNRTGVIFTALFMKFRGMLHKRPIIVWVKLKRAIKVRNTNAKVTRNRRHGLSSGLAVVQFQHPPNSQNI